ncbi:hypothetical protein [Subtercola boreus]|uniref:hypothetical protein n=1 Tax=Subtercola boreus TaxID=120213 RepID=UPI0011C035AC|nr:hypothetical protein [Subtercola boreus]
MVPTIQFWSLDDITERRAALLQEARASIEELRSRNAAFILEPEKQAILRELDDLDYLAAGVRSS